MYGRRNTVPNTRKCGRYPPRLPTNPSLSRRQMPPRWVKFRQRILLNPVSKPSTLVRFRKTLPPHRHLVLLLLNPQHNFPGHKLQRKLRQRMGATNLRILPTKATLVLQMRILRNFLPPPFIIQQAHRSLILPRSRCSLLWL